MLEAMTKARKPRTLWVWYDKWKKHPVMTESRRHADGWVRSFGGTVVEFREVIRKVKK